jgi:hypothetical protein
VYKELLFARSTKICYRLKALGRKRFSEKEAAEEGAFPPLLSFQPYFPDFPHLSKPLCCKGFSIVNNSFKKNLSSMLGREQNLHLSLRSLRRKVETPTQLFGY